MEGLLAARLGGGVRIVGMRRFPHSSVWRCALEAEGHAAPPTVIVRALRGDPARSGLARLLDEQAALDLLEALGSDLAPRCLGVDAAAGLLISEDLGPHPSLLDLLLGADRAAAEAGLLAFAQGLGRLHAATAGRASTFTDLRRRLGPAVEPSGTAAPLVAHWRQVRAAAAQLGLPSADGVDGDVAAVADLLAAPGPYSALSSGDPSVVNCCVAGGIARCFDFEEAGFRHALLDARVLRTPYPTGGPAWRLPPAVAAGLEPAYRAALAPACPAVLDDAGYERGMAAAVADWTIRRLARLARVEAGPDRDPWLLLPPGWSGPIPTRSRRRQLVTIMETGIASAERDGTLGALARWCGRVAGALRLRWPEATEETPLYPAFR